MANDDPQDPSDDAFRSGPMLDVDGRLLNRIERVAPAPEPRREPAPLDDEPIELAERSKSHFDPTPESYRDAAPSKSKRPALFAFAAVVTLAFTVLGLVLAGYRPIRKLLGTTPLDQLAARKHGALVVNSEPPGATVRIAGNVVGTTPWAGDNLWGDTTVSVELAGYRQWTHPLAAGEAATLSATLHR